MTAPVHRPTDVETLQEIMRSTSGSLRIAGGGTKRALGRAVNADATVNTTGLRGIVRYEPAELVLVARPGTPLAEIEESLAAEGQQLAFEPPHWGPTATLGGTVACGLSGPRRFKAGALRDFVLGAQIVDGGGESTRSGGEVVKNVTGYDVPRLLCGSFGTLGLLTEVCLKLWPRPEQTQTLIIHGQSRASALATLLQCARSAYEITGLAYQSGDGQPQARSLIRLEGAASAVAQQAASLKDEISGDDGSYQIETVDAGDSATIWDEVRERPLSVDVDVERWRFAIPPAIANHLIEGLGSLGLERYLVDWAGGLIWAALPPSSDPVRLHALATAHGGTAWRFARGPDDPNDHAFSPLEPGLERLNRTLKSTMDSRGRLNPGCMLPPDA